jgi:hypothetical protein
MGKQRHGAFMAGRVRVMVDQLVQRGARRHPVQQEDKRDQKRGENRPAMPLELTKF